MTLARLAPWGYPDRMPVINNTTSPALRTTIQAAVAELAIRGIETIPDPDMVISTGDRVLLLIVSTGVVSFIQNLVENKMGKSILLPQRTTPLMPEAAPKDPMA